MYLNSRVFSNLVMGLTRQSLWLNPYFPVDLSIAVTVIPRRNNWFEGTCLHCFEVKENKFKLLLVCAHLLNFTSFQFLSTELSKCGVRLRSSLWRKVPSQILLCRNVLTVKTLSHLLVSEGIPFVPNPVLVGMIMLLSFKSIFLYDTVSFRGQMPSKKIET